MLLKVTLQYNIIHTYEFNLPRACRCLTAVVPRKRKKNRKIFLHANTGTKFLRMLSNDTALSQPMPGSAHRVQGSPSRQQIHRGILCSFDHRAYPRESRLRCCGLTLCCIQVYDTSEIGSRKGNHTGITQY